LRSDRALPGQRQSHHSQKSSSRRLANPSRPLSSAAIFAPGSSKNSIADPKDKFGLRDSGFTLKSDVFAQPKPGNWQFAMDFSRIAGSKGTAFVINNNLDWVPQTPLSTAKQLISQVSVLEFRDRR